LSLEEDEDDDGLSFVEADLDDMSDTCARAVELIPREPKYSNLGVVSFFGYGEDQADQPGKR